jgi:hypothetical protein
MALTSAPLSSINPANFPVTPYSGLSSEGSASAKAQPEPKPDEDEDNIGSFQSYQMRKGQRDMEQEKKWIDQPESEIQRHMMLGIEEIQNDRRRDMKEIREMKLMDYERQREMGLKIDEMKQREGFRKRDVELKIQKAREEKNTEMVAFLEYKERGWRERWGREMARMIEQSGRPEHEREREMK